MVVLFSAEMFNLITRLCLTNFEGPCATVTKAGKSILVLFQGGRLPKRFCQMANEFPTFKPKQIPKRKRVVGITERFSATRSPDETLHKRMFQYPDEEVAVVKDLIASNNYVEDIKDMIFIIEIGEQILGL